VISFCQKFPEHELSGIVIDWWSDEPFLARMWDGKESALFSDSQIHKMMEFLAEEGYDKNRNIYG